MRELKFSTRRGKDIYDMGCRCCWSSLSYLYDSWSSAKENAFNWCWQQFVKDPNSTGFAVGNANTFGFTARWYTIIDNENVMRVETKDNSYLVWLDR